jgi:hypothetical protein
MKCQCFRGKDEAQFLLGFIFVNQNYAIVY